MFKKIDPKIKLPEMEREVLKFWEENQVFEKSLENRKDAPVYSFYDGPPFATGTPHYGHLVGSVMKDAVPRYWTMKGFKVPRKWGWDCHGLPIENIAEKELGITRKKQIVEMGVDKFNEFCRTKVLKYTDEWKTVINRLGRWADMENSYKTMDLPFMESVWWVFKQLWGKGLIYEGYRIMHICTRCETTLSQSEVAEGYKDIKDLSATVKFELGDEPGTFVLAWTTTPWTLIGNVALAVGEDINYVKVKVKNLENNSEVIFIVAEKRSDVIAEEYNFNPESDAWKKLLSGRGKFLTNVQEPRFQIDLLDSFKGKELIGKKYKPLFDYYKDKGLQNEENGWKIYAGDFVTTEEGTGVVHIAPAFGEDDLKMGQKYKLPFVQHVGMDGLIKEEAKDFVGMSVKPEKDHQTTDIEVIKYLAKNNLLFSKEKHEHSYPHCWRCDTPLINYATSSWFVNILKIKEEMLGNAKNISWTPKHLKEGRFGNWLEGARDWSISRQRFWASVIPIWKCDKCGEMKVVGSVDEIREQFGNPNKLFLVRHGEAENNVKKILNWDLNKNNYHLTENGKKQIDDLVKTLSEEKIDLIYSSPILRAEETAEILAEKFGVEVIFDDRLREYIAGELEGKTHEEFMSIFPNWPEGSDELRKKYGVEKESEVRARLGDFIEEINKKYKNKNIVIVSHGDPLQIFNGILEKKEPKEIYRGWYPEKGSAKEIYSKSIDLHKHIVDKIIFKCEKCEGVMRRVPDVLDTWFDSGSMPYAQAHYPFEKKEAFDKTYPAEFIAEGIDQTRAWFYYLHAIGTAIKDSNAFKNVIANGIVLAEDGKKMSKRLNNYPDPTEIFDKYGADALRFYLLNSPVMIAETINFKENDVADISRGMMRMLWNSYTFFVLYAGIDKFKPAEGAVKSDNLLDQWIVSELNILIKNVDESMEGYELSKAVRFFPKFIDNLSNWYIRRSRKRFWKSENDTDKNSAYQTLYYVLVELSKLMAPFTPFISEEIYKNLTDFESVHLAEFPKADESLIDEKLNEEMNQVRTVVSEGLQARAKAGIKVRQPLQEVISRYKVSNDELIDIIKEELNVKEFKMEGKLEVDSMTSSTSMGEIKSNSGEFKIADVILKSSIENIEFIKLNTEITPELKLEGQAREIIRHIQEMRKEAGYEVDNRIKVAYNGMFEVFEKFGNIIEKETLAKSLGNVEMEENADLKKEFKIDGEFVQISIKKSL
jgi:isoleucyl-tRNA synthetase